MKRLWLSMAVLFLLFGAGIWNTQRLSRLSDRLIALLSQAQLLAEEDNWSGARQLTREAQGLWEQESGYLYSVLDHTQADEVRVGFQEVLELLDWGEGAEYSSMNTRLMENLRLLAEMEQLTPTNLL